MPSKVKSPPRRDPIGEFHANTAYTFADLRRRGFGGAAIREMQRAGLPVRRLGRVKVVLGDELLDFLRRLPIDSVNEKEAG